MRASKRELEDMREKEYTVNTTFRVLGRNLNDEEDFIRITYDVIDFKIVSDTSELYAKDAHFRKLVKAKKVATVACELHINKHN